jgi:hypothetical protein
VKATKKNSLQTPSTAIAKSSSKENINNSNRNNGSDHGAKKNEVVPVEEYNHLKQLLEETEQEKEKLVVAKQVHFF